MFFVRVVLMKETINELLIGDLVKLDNICHFDNKMKAYYTAMTFKGKVLCLRRNGKLYELESRILFREMKRNNKGSIDITDLNEKHLYIKDVEPILDYFSKYKFNKHLKKRILKEIRAYLKQRGLCFYESPKERILTRIK